MYSTVTVADKTFFNLMVGTSILQLRGKKIFLEEVKIKTSRKKVYRQIVTVLNVKRTISKTPRLRIFFVRIRIRLILINSKRPPCRSKTLFPDFPISET